MEHAEKGIQVEKHGFLEAFRNSIRNNEDGSSSINCSGFKFNAHAPEFVPRSQTPSPPPLPSPIPISGYFVPCFQYLTGGNGGTDWIYLGGEPQDSISLVTPTSTPSPPPALPHHPKTVLTEELQKKILKQMEYQFSDMSLLANDNLAKLISKDPDGFVPVSAVASTKKIKSLVGTNHQLLAQALHASLKLDVSSDGKKVKRKVAFTERVKEDLQLRTVVAENLPDDHSHQNIEKIFNVAGCVKTIRICHPQDPSTRSKGDFIISTKLHALVEFDNPEAAEKAVEMLNDQRNWRKGLRVRCLLRRSPKSVLKKKDFDGILDEEEGIAAEIQSEAHTQTSNPESVAAVAASASATSVVDHNNMDMSIIYKFDKLQKERNKIFSLFSEISSGAQGEENSAASSKKVWNKGRGKSRLRTQTSGGRGLLTLTPQISNSILGETSSRQTIKGPRMPDGTRGFTMGRGRPLNSTPPPPQSCAAAVV